MNTSKTPLLFGLVLFILALIAMLSPKARAQTADFPIPLFTTNQLVVGTTNNPAVTNSAGFQGAIRVVPGCNLVITYAVQCTNVAHPSGSNITFKANVTSDGSNYSTTLPLSLPDIAMNSNAWCRNVFVLPATNGSLLANSAAFRIDQAVNNTTNRVNYVMRGRWVPAKTYGPLNP